MNSKDFLKVQRQEKSLVLVVDDNPRNLQLVASVLNPHYRLLLADSGQKALTIAIEKKPDLLLLDIMMPDLSGFDVSERLRQYSRTRQIPIIFLTARNDEQDITTAFESGGVDFITKPFRASELLARVKTQINLRNTEKRLRQVIDLVPHRLFAKDSEGKLVLANQATASFYASTVDDLLGNPEPPLPEGYHYEVDPDNEPPHHLLENLGSMAREEYLQLPDGTKRFYQTNIISFTFSGTLLPTILQLAIDVTTLKEKQEEISKLNQQLLLHSSHKDRLLTIIAHDLRNQLFGCASALNLLVKKSDTLPKELIVAGVSKLQKSAVQLLNLLQDLLLWSQAQFKAISFTPAQLCLPEELKILILHLQHLAEDKNINLQLEVPDGLLVFADANMLQTILRNLVTNAIKFSAVGQTVKITARERAGKVYISVSDEGVGINARTIKKLLENNMENITTFGTNGEKGSGLGLSISIEFIQQHGGELQIESEEGRGSTFTFSVPVVPGA
jgi:two-component system, sensor histidine kinase and response regulator